LGALPVALPKEISEFMMEALKTFGLRDGLFVIFFLGMHYWVHLQYKGRLSDRQLEIDRVAGDNREYRDRFTRLLDRHFDVTGNPNS
jgi:hypothetical protein